MSRRLAPLVLAVLLCGACDGLPGKPKPGEVDVRPDHVTDFATLYAENCAGCHGPEGKGGAGAIGLASPVYLAIADDAVIRRAAGSGVRGTLMPAFAQSSGGMLTDAQIEILVKGIRGWASPNALGGATPPPYAGSGGDATRGAAVAGGLVRELPRHGRNRRSQSRLDRRRLVPGARQRPVAADDDHRGPARHRPARLEKRRRGPAALGPGRLRTSWRGWRRSGPRHRASRIRGGIHEQSHHASRPPAEARHRVERRGRRARSRRRSSATCSRPRAASACARR